MIGVRATGMTGLRRLGFRVAQMCGLRLCGVHVMIERQCCSLSVYHSNTVITIYCNFSH